MSIKYLDTIVNLGLPKDEYLYSKEQWRLMQEWIQKHRCRYSPVYDYMNNGIPNVVLLEAQDAVAFKIRFGL